MVTKATRDVVDLHVRPVTNIDINGGTIDGTPIGTSDPDEGHFTNSTVDNLTVTNTLDISGANVIGAIYAYYADLAECYMADKIYEPGTVVKLGGEEEITAADPLDKNVFGIISTAPAVVLNNEQRLTSDHSLPVGLIGRVPCKVVGKIKKFDRLVIASNGVARAFIEHYDSELCCFARSLETSDDEGERLVLVSLTRV